MMATMVMALGCRSSGAASQPPSDVAAVHPPADQRAHASNESVGEAESDARAERYLAEERWNVAASEEPEPPRADGRNRFAPTQAEFDAWDRNDPEKRFDVSDWDAFNFVRMEGYFHDLECYHSFMVAAGEAGRGAAPGTKAAKAWAEAKRQLVGELDTWPRQLFTNEPRLLEHSKYVGKFLEAHELISRELPPAYDGDDQLAIDKAEAHWTIVVANVDKYTRALGRVPTRVGDAHCKAMRGP